MIDATHKRFIASDRSYFALIKKDVHQLAEDAGFDASKLADLDLVISELTSNLHKYAKNGEILAGIFETENNQYIELICIDSGPGMISAQRMLTDGLSSSNTLGLGLGCIKRRSDEFDIYSQKDWGTIVLSRIFKKAVNPRATNDRKVTVRPLVVTMPGEKKSGDGIYYTVSDQYFKILVADGLGHGPEANYAVNEAVTAFKAFAPTSNSPAETLRHIHHSIKKTRGVVATIVIFDFKTKIWKVSGVGNIATRLSNFLEMKNQMAYNGIVGHNIPHTIDDQQFQLADYHQITLCSDGMKSRWEMNKFAGINRCDLTIQAAAIYKDFARQTDDMTVVMAKISMI